MKKLLLILLMVLPLSTLTFAQYTWTQKAAMQMQRYTPCAFTIGAYSYVGTGYIANSVPTTDWWRYDPATNSWSQMANMTGPRSGASSFVINGKAYVGLGLTSGQFYTDLQEYNPATNSWTAKASFPGQGRYGAAGFAIGNTGYFVYGNMGSATGPYSTAMYGYNATNNTWSTKASFPGTSRYGGRGVVVDNKAYVCGGVNGIGNSSSLFFDDLWQYDPVSDSWTMKASLPAIGRQYPTVLELDGKVIVGNGIHWTGFFSDFHAYDPGSNSWSAVPSMPANEARWGAGAFTNANEAYVATGNKSFNNPVVIENDLWKLSLTSSLSPEEDPLFLFGVYTDAGSDQINITMNSSTSRLYQVFITSADGKICLDKNITNGTTTIDAGSLSSGIYFATLLSEDGEKIKTEKFLVNRY